MKTYIISRMYAGSYLNDNLGGEIINLLHDDCHRNYISVEPSGYISAGYNDTVEAVIMTRLVRAGCFEIIGVGIIGKDGQIVRIKAADSKEDKAASAHRQAIEYIKRNDVAYAGVSLSDITGSLTFQSEELLLPKSPLYLIDSTMTSDAANEDHIYGLDDVQFPRQSLRQYITDANNPKAFSKITQIINDEDLWNISTNNRIAADGKSYEDEQHYNFLRLIRKEDDELVFSNMFHYFFSKYNDLLISFAKEILNVELSGAITIEREKANIDLWISDANTVIVIENKIKSGINGVSPRNDSDHNKQEYSQLEKYYNYAEQYAKENGIVQKGYYIFVPDYNKVDLSNYSKSKEYKKIKYSTLYDFFQRQKQGDLYYKDIDFYYNEFVNALFKHTKDRENDYAEDMAYRFLRMIKRIKQKEQNKELALID